MIMYETILATKNESFINQSQLLFNLKILNNCFMFNTINPRLRKVDDIYYNISKRLEDDIIQECKDNVWFLARNVMMFNHDTNSLCRYPINRQALAMLYTLEQGYNIYAEHSRQTLCTITSLLYAIHKRLNGYSLKIVGSINNDAKCLYNKLNEIINNLPEYMVKKIQETQSSNKRLILIDNYSIFERDLASIKQDIKYNPDTDQVIINATPINLFKNRSLLDKNKCYNMSMQMIPFNENVYDNNSLLETISSNVMFNNTIKLKYDCLDIFENSEIVEKCRQLNNDPLNINSEIYGKWL